MGTHTQQSERKSLRPHTMRASDKLTATNSIKSEAQDSIAIVATTESSETFAICSTLLCCVTRELSGPKEEEDPDF